MNGVSDLLTEEEIRDLTKKKRGPAQERVLTRMGIESKPRGDGTLAVLRARRDEALGLRHDKSAPTNNNEINWGDVATSAQA